MKINEQLATPDNYRVTVATEEQIINFLQGIFDKVNDVAEIIDSFRSNGWAMQTWLRACRDGIVPFQQSTYHNLIPSVLRNSLATLISGTTVTPTFKANYFALGTSSTAPANTDTQLAAETVRLALTNRSSYTNIAYLDVFFPSTSVGGNTYLEAGIFVDGSGSANSGYLLSHVAINQTLGSSQTLTVNSSITIS